MSRRQNKYYSASPHPMLELNDVCVCVCVCVCVGGTVISMMYNVKYSNTVCSNKGQSKCIVCFVVHVLVS